MDVSALVDELTARVTEELDYTSRQPPSSRQQLALRAAEFCVPPVLATAKSHGE